MKIGILGTGFMGRMHAGIYKAIPGVEVAGLVGRALEKTKATAEALDVPWSLSMDELLNRGDVDVIDVCYPSKFHTEAVIAALKAGKHVFCETPVAYTNDEADAMSLAALSANKLLMVALFDRFLSPYQEIYRILKKGLLGHPRMVFANRRTSPYWPLPVEDPSTMEPIVNLMIHDFDVLHWLLGRATSVTAHGQKGPSGTEEHVIAAVEYDDCLAWVEGTAIMPGSFPFSTSLRVVGDEAAVDLNWAMGSQGPNYGLILYPSNGSPQKLSIQDFNPYETECRYMVECLRGNTDPSIFDINAARDSLQMTLAAKASLECEEKKVKIAWKAI